MDWFYADGDQQVGPVDEDQLRQLLQLGAIRDDSLVWHPGMPDWIPYGKIVGGIDGAESTSMTSCHECDRTFPRPDLVTLEDALVCEECKPKYLQRVGGDRAIAGAYTYGGFWIRFAAAILDGLIIAVLSLVLLLPMAVLLNALFFYFEILALLFPLTPLLVGLCYCAIFHGKYGATPGKMACKLKVIRADGSRLTYGRAIGRYFAWLVSACALGVGFTLAGIDREKRALHDHMCETRVISPR